MCVISVCREDRLTPRMVDKMWSDSPHMGGVAWRAPVKGVDHVFWKKGLTLKEMHDVAQSVPLPAVFHFRKQTVGGECPELNHPFPVTRKVETLLEGHTQGGVLFHNGTLQNWEDRLLKACVDFKLSIPDDELSDSRAIAFLTSIYGKNYMNLLPDNQRGVYFSPTELIYFQGDPKIKGGDAKWDKRGTIYVSQTRWDTTETSFGRICSFQQCKEPAMKDGRCRIHPFQGVTTNLVAGVKTPAKVFISPFVEAVVRAAESQRTAGLIGSKDLRRIKTLTEKLVTNQAALDKLNPSRPLVLPMD